MWDLETGRCLRVFEGHTGSVFSVAWRADAVQALSGSWDNTVRVWDIKTGSCLRVFEGHTSDVRIVAWGANQRLAISTSNDKTIRLWDVETGSCLRIIEGHASGLRSVAWTSDQCHVLSGDLGGGIRLWDLSKYLVDEHAPEAPAPALPPAPGQVQYTNAKVLLVGDTSAGKTGLSMRLALNDWKPSDSTIGAWATHWKLPPPPSPARFIPLSR
jgi:WD40 repeat protein